MMSLYPFMCGILTSDWVDLQTTYFNKIGSWKCPQRWASQLASKLIKIIYDMWNHRNKVLYQKDNSITEDKYKEQNEQIQRIYEDLPNM